MKGRLVALIIHADDFGITVEQSKAILELSDACGGHGALSSMSMFANSPAFSECAELVRPFVDAGKIKQACTSISWKGILSPTPTTCRCW